jgi:cold shock CspA family protein
MPQGTVKRYDVETRTAVLLDDQLRQFDVDREAIAASGALELRLGQRVRFELEEGPADELRVTNIHIVSM